MPLKGQKQERRACEICGKMVGRSGYTGHLRSHEKSPTSVNNPTIKLPDADVEQPAATIMQAALRVIEASNELQRLLLLELASKKVA